MTSDPGPEGLRCEIVLGRRLSGRSATALREFERVDLPGRGTLLRGRVADQATLHGVLARIRDLGIPLVAVRVGDGIAGAEAGQPADDGRGDGPLDGRSLGDGAAGETADA